MAIRSGTKIVVITGDNTVNREAPDAGAKVFLKKPTEIKAITETINNW